MSLTMRRRMALAAASLSVGALALLIARWYRGETKCVLWPSGGARIHRIVALIYDSDELGGPSPTVVATREDSPDVIAIWETLLAGAERHPGVILPDGSRGPAERQLLAQLEFHLDGGSRLEVGCCAYGILAVWSRTYKRSAEYRVGERLLHHALKLVLRSVPGTSYEREFQREEKRRREERTVSGER